jgi:hypothetical protein
MGVEFIQNADEQQAQAGKFIQAMKAGTSLLEFTVLPEGMDDEDLSGAAVEPLAQIEDPLLNLFRRSAELTSESFREELRAQRRARPASQSASSAV